MYKIGGFRFTKKETKIASCLLRLFSYNIFIMKGLLRIALGVNPLDYFPVPRNPSLKIFNT